MVINSSQSPLLQTSATSTVPSTLQPTIVKVQASQLQELDAEVTARNWYVTLLYISSKCLVLFWSGQIF